MTPYFPYSDPEAARLAAIQRDWDRREAQAAALDAAAEWQAQLAAASPHCPPFDLHHLLRDYWLARIRLDASSPSPPPATAFPNTRLEGARAIRLLDPQTLLFRSSRPAADLREAITILFLPR